MPTGYTSQITKETTFEDFVLICARAFGALIHMRDMPSDAPIPDKIEPSSYHIKKLSEIEAEQVKFVKLDLKGRQDLHQAEHREETERKIKSAKAKHKQLELYSKILYKVMDWNPPTEGHKELKTFMQKQLNETIKFDCCGTLDAHEGIQPFNVWEREKTSAFLKGITYHKKEHKKEVERCENRTKWISALKAGL